MTPEMEARFRQGIAYFNQGYFFEAHDTFEEMWMDERHKSKRFFQGLVQVSTGFYHLVMKNAKGAESQLTKGLGKLHAYAPEYLGLDVGHLIGEVKAIVRQLNRAPLEKLVSRIPRIRFLDPIQRN